MFKGIRLHIALISLIMAVSPALSFADELMRYAQFYQGCVDDEPSEIYGGTYSEYPEGLTDAEFPGGVVAMVMFLQQNLETQEVYTGQVDKKGNKILKTGEVLVEFVVDRCGLPGRFKVIQPLSPEQDEEALRVVRMLPVFRAPTLDGYRVKAAYVAHIRFTKTKWEYPMRRRNSSSSTDTTDDGGESGGSNDDEYEYNMNQYNGGSNDFLDW